MTVTRINTVKNSLGHNVKLNSEAMDEHTFYHGSIKRQNRMPIPCYFIEIRSYCIRVCNVNTKSMGHFVTKSNE